MTVEQQVAAQNQVNSATLIMGNSGTGKSSLGYTLAAYLWETFRKVLLYHSADGGGVPAAVQAAQRLGILRLFRMRSRGYAFETPVLASKGWWPSRINPVTGEVAPGVAMVPPITQTFVLRCTNGHVVKSVRFQSQLTPAMCATCKLQVTKENGVVEATHKQTRGFEQVGGVFFDSLSAMLSWQMMDMAGRQGRMELRGEETAIGGRIIDGNTAFGANNRSHYGFAQTRAEEMATNALSIPNLVVPPVFTALLLESTDKGGLLIKGPKLAGEAKTAEGPQWFGNCLESTTVTTERGETVFRLHLREYIDDQGARHLCKNRAAPGTMPPWLEDPPEAAEAFTQFNLGVFFRLLEEGTKKTEEAMEARYADAPGVGEEMVYGDGDTAPATTPAVAAAPAAASAPKATPAAGRPRAGAPRGRAVAPTAAPHPATLEDVTAEAPISAPPVEDAPPAAVVPPTDVTEAVSQSVAASAPVPTAAPSRPVARPAPAGGGGARPAPSIARPAGSVPPPPGARPAPRAPAAAPRPKAVAPSTS